jgi:hypothetical protein
MAEELYHAFTVISGMRYRVVVIAEQRVQDRWNQMSTTELSTFSPRNRHPRMPSRPPPPPPPAAADDQRVPQGPPPPSPPPQQRTKSFPRDLQRSLQIRLMFYRSRTFLPSHPSLSLMRQGPCRSTGEHRSRGGVQPLDLASHLWPEDPHDLTR